MTESKRAVILIADDEPLFLRTTGELLRKEGFDCRCVADASAALDVLSNERVDLILSDLNMPGNLRLELLRQGRDRWPEIPLIVVTGVPSLPTAIESVRLGIADYLLKPVKYDDLLASIRRVLARRDGTDSRRSPAQTDAADLDDRFPDIVGRSPKMLELFEIFDRVAKSDANVLVTGESGTGKEVVARAIHRRSARSQAKFQVIDCTAIPETLFESLLFGHAKGAFTGAVREQVGLLADADGGTAFFDELGELPASLQAKLLRVVQEKAFTPVGGRSEIRIDARFVCATNRDLQLEVDAGRFRRDLFYRLSVINIELPPLRERGDDVLLLAERFLEALRPSDSAVRGFSDDALDRLRAHSWPGNVRELRNVVERGLALATSERIEVRDLPEVLRSTPPVGSGRRSSAANVSLAEALDDAERDYLVSLLREHAGNVSRVAASASMSRQGMYKLLKKHGLSAGEYRGAT
jgi:DNA-binding NtrC family response regulator